MLEAFSVLLDIMGGSYKNPQKLHPHSLNYLPNTMNSIGIPNVKLPLKL